MIKIEKKSKNQLSEPEFWIGPCRSKKSLSDQHNGFPGFPMYRGFDIGGGSKYFWNFYVYAWGLPKVFRQYFFDEIPDHDFLQKKLWFYGYFFLGHPVWKSWFCQKWPIKGQKRRKDWWLQRPLRRCRQSTARTPTAGTPPCLDLALTLPWHCLHLAFTSSKFSPNHVSNSWDIPDMYKCHQNKCCLDKCHCDSWNLF